MKSKIVKYFTISIAILPLTAFAQADMPAIECNEIYYQTSDYQFNEEWQYLSTDVYLMNMGSFEALFNEACERSSMSPRKKRNAMNSVFISAQLQGSILNGITYPLYNFVVDNNAKLNVIDSYDRIRIINNMPLTSADNVISAKMTLEIIPKSRTEWISEFVNRQMGLLKNLSLQGVVNALKDELINLSTQQNQKYVFSSVIQIYKDFNPDTKIHSIGVYAFLPSGGYCKLGYDDEDNLRRLLRGDVNINKQTLQSRVTAMQYPYLVVVNYKSRYTSNLDIAQISEESIIERNKRINAEYKNHEIFPVLFDQENKLTDFLKKYVKLNKDNEKFNIAKRNSDLLDVMNSYNELRYLWKQRLTDFSNSKVFKDIFKAHYDNVLAKAELDMKGNPSLKKAIEIINLLDGFDQKHNYGNVSENEHVLALFSDFGSGSDEISLKINVLKPKIENAVYQNVFSRLADNLYDDDDVIELTERMKTTNCVTCKQKAQNAIDDYNRRQQEKAEAAAADSIAKLQVLDDKLNKRLLSEKQNAASIIQISRDFSASTDTVSWLKSNFSFLLTANQLKTKTSELEKLVLADYDSDKEEAISKIQSASDNLNIQIQNANAEYSNLKDKHEKQLAEQKRQREQQRQRELEDEREQQRIAQTHRAGIRKTINQHKSNCEHNRNHRSKTL